ncbi:ankyrin repeat domain-containing protein [Leptospira bandrabouensis]|uniref:ankyrin repeat domain-containing protein n=1 Tax=Leptospira bandrabouensis TaxID=2484903 RepID=UPI00223E335F|nr:ankyrin repeat domain-containing protein [Leptospira bandrabouensis]MCW7460208.1 ankyrin repeat domain-containing protein [Leptospira bandrabouensis]MCW7478355.1 ankyrin repeat domain-containing protein [Leptospira bandrabouensis]MCW7486361.1 ankyrin repeat domain-containing protein [Leptospira bandrabouensis]
MNADKNLPEMNPFRGGLISIIRLFTPPVLAILLIVFVRYLSGDVSWKRNLLAASFLCYYIAVSVFGTLRAASAVEDILGEEDIVEDKISRMRRARHSIRVFFSLWLVGGVAILAGLYVGMSKNRWDMPIPLPSLQILSSVIWAILSSLLLQLMSFHRGLVFAKGGSTKGYIAQSITIYGFLILLFPIYFVLYAGNGKIVNIPYLIAFTLPANILLVYLVVKKYNSVIRILGENSVFFFHPETKYAAKRAFGIFLFVFILISLFFLDYTRRKKLLWIYAARENQILLFDVLRLTGVHVNEVDEHNYTPLFWAVQGGSIDFVKSIVKAGADLEARNEFGQTPLILAVLVKNEMMVQELISLGSDINCADSLEGQTPLILAARDGSLEIVKILLKNKANPNLKNKKGQSALSLALDSGHKEIADLLKK